MQLLFRCRHGCRLLVFLLKLEEVLVQRGGSAKGKFRHRSHYGVRMNRFGVQKLLTIDRQELPTLSVRCARRSRSGLGVPTISGWLVRPDVEFGCSTPEARWLCRLDERGG